MKNIILLYAFLVIVMLGGNNGVFASSFNKMLESNNFDSNDITNAENIIIHYCMKYTDSAATQEDGGEPAQLADRAVRQRLVRAEVTFAA